MRAYSAVAGSLVEYLFFVRLANDWTGSMLSARTEGHPGALHQFNYIINVVMAMVYLIIQVYAKE